MFEDGHADRSHVTDGHLIGSEGLLHYLAPGCVDGPKAWSHGSQSGDFRKLDGDCRNLCRKARAKASGVS